jgi:hypothetical protein
VTGICTVRLPARPTVRVRTTLEPGAVRTARVGPPAAFAGVAAGADAGTAGARSVGAVTCGKCAVGSDSSGIAAGAGRASTSERIASVIITTYGSANEIAHATANQNRMRRLPRPFRPKVPAVPKPCAPENAGISRLPTYTHPADPHCCVFPPRWAPPSALRRPPLPWGSIFPFFKVPDRRVRSQYRAWRKVPAYCGIIRIRVVKNGRAGAPRLSPLGRPALRRTDPGVPRRGVTAPAAPGVAATSCVQSLPEPQTLRSRLAFDTNLPSCRAKSRFDGL